MANIKSAKKRILQNQRKTEINKFRRSRIRSGIKNLSNLIANNKKGVYKKNTASRIISRLSQKIKSLSK